MEIRNLKNIGLDKIVDCTLEAFKNYFVQMPSSLEYWNTRFKGARVDFEQSFGAFEKGKLIGFIITGVDQINGKLTAFNTGTGVIEQFRGQKVIDQIYSFAIPSFRQRGVCLCQLEVIQDNKRAIRVYERIGFKITRKLNCFNGKLDASPRKIKIQKTSFEKIMTIDSHCSWDHKNEAISILRDNYESYIAINEQGRNIGYFVINNEHNYLAQFGSAENNYDDLLIGISKIANEIRVINVDEKLTPKIESISKFGLINNINQFEMEMKID